MEMDVKAHPLGLFIMRMVKTTRNGHVTTLRSHFVIRFVLDLLPGRFLANERELT